MIAIAIGDVVASDSEMVAEPEKDVPLELLSIGGSAKIDRIVGLDGERVGAAGGGRAGNYS